MLDFLTTWLQRNPLNPVLALALPLLAAGLVVGSIATMLGQSDGLFAAGAAAGVCLMGAELGRLIGLPFRQPQTLWLGVLLGMLPRLGLPMGFAVFCTWQDGRLAKAGFLYYLLVFYLVSLGLETALTLLRTAPHSALSQRPSKTTSS